MPGGRMGRRMAVASRRGQASELMATWSTELQLWTFKLTLYTVLHSMSILNKIQELGKADIRVPRTCDWMAWVLVQSVRVTSTLLPSGQGADE